jgi:hypothetical protein
VGLEEVGRCLVRVLADHDVPRDPALYVIENIGKGTKQKRASDQN